MDQGIIEMLEYNAWANRTLVEACMDLDEQTLKAQPQGVSDSVAALFTHLAGGQQTFALRPKGRQHEGELNRRSPWPGMAEIAKILEQTNQELIEIARETAEDAEVVLPYMGRKPRFPVRFFLVHAVEHGTEHRTEIKVALNALGIPNPNLDGWEFAAAQGYGQED